ncbi:MAG TPA: hypothetical protein VGH33_01745 [Isosphaeraceae bacterium]|jgi:hypothetical protein
MIATAVAALSIGGWTLWRRSSEFRLKADLYRQLAAKEAEAVKIISDRKSGIEPPQDPDLPQTPPDIVPPDYDDLLERAGKFREIYRREWQRYDRAARYPWLPLAAYPSAPE